MTSFVTLGSDPEVFLFDEETNEFISSVGLIGGSKDLPRLIDNLGNAVQEDNVTVEFNTPPCSNVDDFVKHIRTNKQWIEERAKILGYGMKIVPSARFTDEQLDSYGAQTFGCEPDFNAWNKGDQNPRPRAKDENLRSCGGHIHVAIPKDKKLDVLDLVKAMDLFVGCQMLTFDHDTQRRELYGKAGAFRPKKYGFEYRTASNAWIQSDELIRWVWDQTDKAVDFVASGKTISEQQGQMIQDCINNSDLVLLDQINREFGL